MQFFGDDQNLPLSQTIAKELNIPVLYPEITVFADGERRVRLGTKMKGQDVVILKTSSITPNIDSFVLETSFLVDAVQRNGAKKITLVLPYLPYSRASHLFGEGESIPFEVVVGLFETVGITGIIFVDPHASHIESMFSVPAKNISALPLFAENILSSGFDKKNSLLVSPDKGGLRRVEDLSKLLGGAKFLSLEKTRDHTTGKVSIKKIKKRVTDNCWIIDDMITSGATAIKACEALKVAGAKNVYLVATHGIFSGNAHEEMENSNFKKVIVTDSLPVNKKLFKKLEVLSLGSVIAKEL